MQDLWQNCVEQLAQELPEQQFNTWIKPLQATFSSDFSKITILVGNRFKLDWIRTQYSKRLSSILTNLYGQTISVELALSPKEHVSVYSSASVTSEADFSYSPPSQVEEPAEEPFKSRLNPSLTFESFVEGSANRMARAAAMHVASIPGHLYNPLFIYGGVGLGKTHLVQSIIKRQA